MSSTKRGAGVRSAAEAALRTLSYASVAVLLVLGLGPRTGAYRTMTVLTGSMRPAFAPGAMLVVTPTPAALLREGDVITYNVPVGDRQVVSHRIVEILERGIEPVVVTQGDANTRPDPWTARLTGGTAWKVRFAVPQVGGWLALLRHPVVRQFTVVVSPMMLAAVWIVRIWRRGPEMEQAPAVWEFAPGAPRRGPGVPGAVVPSGGAA